MKLDTHKTGHTHRLPSNQTQTRRRYMTDAEKKHTKRTTKMFTSTSVQLYHFPRPFLRGYTLAYILISVDS